MKKNKTTCDRIKDAADVVRFVELILYIIGGAGLFLLPILFSYNSDLGFSLGIINLFSCFILGIILHAFYCFLYGFGDMVESTESMANGIHALTGDLTSNQPCNHIDSPEEESWNNQDV